MRTENHPNGCRTGQLVWPHVWRHGLATLLALTSAPSWAENNPYYVSLSQSYTHDTNLLRLADAQDVPEGFSRVDTVSSTALLGGVDQGVGRQRLFGNLALRSNRYGHNTQFNNTSYTAQAGLDWSTVERVSGTIVGNASRSLQPFSADTFNPTRATNLESSRALNASLNVGLVTLYSLEASLGARSVDNSLTNAAVKARDFRSVNADLGLRVRPSAISNFGLAISVAQGRYPKYATDERGLYVQDRFRVTSPVFTMSLVPTGASTIDLRLAHTRTVFDLNQRRDFSGLTGNLAWTWRLSGKTQLTSSYGRDSGQDAYARLTLATNQPTSLDYSRAVTTFRLQAAHDWSAKLALTGGVTRASRDLVRTLNDPLIAFDAVGRDHTTVVSLGVRWAPRRFALAGCDLSRERRSGAGDLTYSYHAGTATCFAQLTLQ